MRTIIALSILALGAICGNATAILTLDPPSGVLQGTPGETVGWGFTLTPDATEWISVVTTATIGESNPGLGTYVDLAGFLGGPNSGVLPPGATGWTVSFDPVNNVGFGSFTIDPGALPGSVDRGFLDLNYELFSGDPNVCSSCAAGFVDMQAPFEIDVVALPEPNVGWLIGPMVVLIWWKRRAPARD